jgi:hypothetical protein
MAKKLNGDGRGFQRRIKKWALDVAIPAGILGSRFRLY